MRSGGEPAWVHVKMGECLPLPNPISAARRATTNHKENIMAKGNNAHKKEVKKPKKVKPKP